MKAAYRIFGTYAFRKVFRENHSRNPINKALFETWSVALGSLSEDDITLLENGRSALTKAAMDLLSSSYEFERAISVGTQDVRKVKERFRQVERLIQNVLTPTNADGA